MALVKTMGLEKGTVSSGRSGEMHDGYVWPVMASWV